MTRFLDSSCEETVLQVESNAEGENLISFHLYDSRGILALDSDGPRTFPSGHEVRAEDEELLLRLPLEPDGVLEYRLYNRDGRLMTCSDGVHTQIYGFLRIEGNKRLPGRRS